MRSPLGFFIVIGWVLTAAVSGVTGRIGEVNTAGWRPLDTRHDYLTIELLVYLRSGCYMLASAASIAIWSALRQLLTSPTPASSWKNPSQKALNLRVGQPPLTGCWASALWDETRNDWRLRDEMGLPLPAERAVAHVICSTQRAIFPCARLG